MSSWVSSKKNRRSALSSCWIRRLCPPGLDHSPPSHVSCFPLLFPPPQEVDVVKSPEIVAGFGPFRLLPIKNPPPPPLSEVVCSLFQHRRRLTSGILDGLREPRFASDLRPSHDFIGEPPPKLHPVDFQVAAASPSVATRQGYASRGKDRDDNHPVATARRHFYHPHAFSFDVVRNPSERQSYRLSSEPEEPFSYWNMGSLERRNFVCSVYPATSLPITAGRKRAANTQGACFPSKVGRFCSED